MAKRTGGTRATGSGSASASRTVATAPKLYSAPSEKFTRSVSLGLSTSDATAAIDHTILEGVAGQLSDGIWENSTGMEKFWKSMEFAQDAKGDVALRTSTLYRDYIYKWDNRMGKSIRIPRNKVSGFADMTDKSVRSWLAGKIRSVFNHEKKEWNGNIGEWSSSNTNKMDYLDGVRVSDAYSLYKRLKG